MKTSVQRTTLFQEVCRWPTAVSDRRCTWRVQQLLYAKIESKQAQCRYHLEQPYKKKVKMPLWTYRNERVLELRFAVYPEYVDSNVLVGGHLASPKVYAEVHDRQWSFRNSFLQPVQYFLRQQQ